MKIIYLFLLIAYSFSLFAQQEHKGALEGIIVEQYYVSDLLDAGDTDGGHLSDSSVTYRIYVDMKPGYKLQTVYGNLEHEMRIETTTQFFNNEDRGETSGDVIASKYLKNNTVALDSWVSMGAASASHYGILKSDDTNGSIVGGENNDGGSNEVSGGLLVNDDTCAGIPVTVSDGLISGAPPKITVIGIDLSVFGDKNAGPVFSATDGAWSVLEGIQGPNQNNRILIAQITTDGVLSCKLNFQIGITDSIRRALCSDTINWNIKCPVNVIQYVNEVQADSMTDTKYIYYHPDLTFTASPCKTNKINKMTDGKPSLKLYPNPADHSITIETPGYIQNQMIYSIHDVYGRTVYYQEYNSSVKNQQETIDISSFSPGIYFVIVTADGFRSCHRFSKY